MPTTYNVRIWKTDVYEGKRVTTYTVRWSVAGRRWKQPYRTAAAANSFRSELLAASKRGEAFDTDTGRPVSMDRPSDDTTWYDFACLYVDLKWPQAAATTRRTTAEALTAVTMLMFTTGRGKPAGSLLRSALTRYGFNTNRRDSAPEDIARALGWVSRNTRPVAALADPAVLRPVINGLAVRLDGTRRAASVVRRWRSVLTAAAGYAVERRLLASNPVPAMKSTNRAGGRATVRPVDRRSVANPVQMRSLLAAVRDQRRSGPHMFGFFACLYFAALRPEEAVSLTRADLDLPAPRVLCGGCGADMPTTDERHDGDPCDQCGGPGTRVRHQWGELHLSVAEPYAGKEWTDSGDNRDRRQLKQRDPGETRTVPAPPELVAILRAHLARFGTAADGRLFRGERNPVELPKLTIVRSWQRARESTFTPEVVASPLARVPYDLRHAAVSTWLNGGVPATDVAEWAGHSVEVLNRIYAKCVDGSAAVLRARVQAALGHGPD